MLGKKGKASKSGKMKGGKGGLSIFGIESDKKDISEIYEGSLSNKFVVIVTLKDGLPRKAKILSCRLTKSMRFMKVCHETNLLFYSY